jgi:histidinol-phosphate aminotransferase
VIDWDALARPSLRGLVRYDPGQSRDSIRAQLGLDALEPLHWNEDRFEPPRRVLEAAAAEVFNAALYPEHLFADFRDGLSGWLGVPSECLTPAHGAQALIAALAQVFVGPGTPVVIPNLTYGLYAAVCSAAGGVVTRVPPAGLAIDLDAVAAAAVETDARLVWICDPNNPTGTLIEPDAWTAFLGRLPAGCVVIADETYIDFADPAVRVDRRRDVREGRPVIVIRSFSKILGLAGLRVGFAISDPEVARLLDLVQEPFNVNRAALAAGIAGVADPAFVDRRRAEVGAARELLIAELGAAGLATYPSQSNFVLVDLGIDDVAVCEALKHRGILVRGGTEFGLPGIVRVTIAPEPVMRRAAAEIARVVSDLRRPHD